MFKKYLLAITFITFVFYAQSQSINPDITTEVCPGQEITFAVTVPGTQAILTGWALNIAPLVTTTPYNISSTTSSTTFNFKGKFADYNNKQTFRVYYNIASGAQVFYDFTFPKIKSLQSESAFSVIYASPNSIAPERCKILSYTISFSNIPYSNPYEIPAISYGTVTAYEYLLPNDWSMNGTTSTGSNWIAGANSATITTDLTHGDGGFIQIRAVNSCGTGLIKGQAYNCVSITRPAPNLFLNGNAYICSSANSQYAISNLPAGATVAWSITPATGIVSLSQSANQATLVRVGSANGTVTLTASITDVCNNNNVLTKTISVSNNQFVNSSYNYNGDQLPMQYFLGSNYNSICNLATTTATIQSNINAPITWNKISSSQLVNWSQSGNSITFYLFTIGATAVFEATSSCGVVNQFAFKSVNCPGGGCGNTGFTVYPNPIIKGHGKIIIHPNILPPNCFNGGGGNEYQIRIFDNQGVLRVSKSYIRGTKEVPVDVSNLNQGIYNIQISNGKTSSNKALMIN